MADALHLSFPRHDRTLKLQEPLTQPRCNRFADSLIEHPPLILLLDLILLKPRVFLHLLFNRGTKPLEAVRSGSPDGADLLSNAKAGKVLNYKLGNRNEKGKENDPNGDRHRRLRWDVLYQGALTVVAETILILSPTVPSHISGSPHASQGQGNVVGHAVSAGEAFLILRTALMVLVNLVTQHATTTGLALLLLKLRGWYPSSGQSDQDGRKKNFQPILIPLTLLYTSLLPLLLQLFLSIWSRPSSQHEAPPSLGTSSTQTFSGLSSLVGTGLGYISPLFGSDHVGGQVKGLVDELGGLERGLIDAWFSADRMWIGTRLLGGMSAGFGLRVLLPTSPIETTGVVLAGWVGAEVAKRATLYLFNSPA